MLDVAHRLREAEAGPRGAGRRRADRGRRRHRLLRGQPHLLARRSPSWCASCAWPARATCWPSWRGCASSWTPRACSTPRSGCRGRRCRAPSAWSPARPARRATTCWPGWRGAAGRDGVVWAFAPVQDRRAAPAITRALQDLAATGEVDTIVVARGGGSLADMFAFCDETLCRTVALLAVPVISSVGHHTDRTLIDDVAAVACSTPTHAAEQAVRIHCDEARTQLARSGARLRDAGPADRGPARAPAGRADARPGRAPGARAPPPAPAAARAARRRVAPHGRRAARHAHPPDGAGAQGRERPPGPTPPAGARTWSACAWRWPRTIPSARWSAATRWSRRATTSW